MPYKNKEARRIAAAKYRAKWTDDQWKKHYERTASWRARNQEYHDQLISDWARALKLEVLTHYGKEGRLECASLDCSITDIDMLTLDHVNNNGAAHRKEIGNGKTMYNWVRKNGFPEGFQTLCANHQLKKEINLRRK